MGDSLMSRPGGGFSFPYADHRRGRAYRRVDLVVRVLEIHHPSRSGGPSEAHIVNFAGTTLSRTGSVKFLHIERKSLGDSTSQSAAPPDPTCRPADSYLSFSVEYEPDSLSLSATMRKVRIGRRLRA